MGWEEGIPRIRDSLFPHVNKKELSSANMGKSITSECVIQILFTSAETWAGFEVSHSYPFGPIQPCHCSQMVWRRMRSSGKRGGGGIIFSSLHWNLTCWLSSSILPLAPAEECRAQHAGAWLQETTFFMLCVEGVLKSAPLKFGYEGPKKRVRGKGRQRSLSFRRIICAAQLC